MGASDRFREAILRRPWAPFVVVAPLVALFVHLAVEKWQRYRSFGREPRELGAAEALREAEAGREVWARLTDARFACEESAVFGQQRFARLQAPGLDASAPLFAAARWAECPPAGEPLVGVAGPVNPKRFERVSQLLGGPPASQGRPPAVFDLAEGPARDRTDFFAIAFLAVFFAVGFGGLGYIARYEESKLERRPRGYVPTPRLLEALGRPPLRRRAGVVAAPALVGLLFVAVTSVVGYAAREGVVDASNALFDEPARWAAARPLATLGRPDVTVWGRLDLFDNLLATVEVSWVAAAEPEAPRSKVSYGTLLAPDLEGPVEVRVDGRGYLTNVGSKLAAQRVLSALFGVFMALGFAAMLAGLTWQGLRTRSRRRRARDQLVARPSPLFVPLLGQRIERQYGFATGRRTYRYEAPSGARCETTFGSWRRAVFDESGERVLVVVPEGDEGAEPVLVAEDGYPFVIAKARP